MLLRLTFIDDETAIARSFLEQLDEGESVEIQCIRSSPFFDVQIEGAIGRFSPHLIVLDLLLHQNIQSGLRVFRKLKESKTLGNIEVVLYSDWIGTEEVAKEQSLIDEAKDAISKFDSGAPQRILAHARAAATPESES